MFDLSSPRHQSIFAVQTIWCLFCILFINRRTGERRCLSVYKTKNTQGADKEVGPSKLEFSEEARQVLLDLFTHYPPDDAELNGDAVKNPGDKATKIRWKSDQAFSRPSMQKHDIAKKVQTLACKLNDPGQLRKVVYSGLICFFSPFNFASPNIPTLIPAICDVFKLVLKVLYMYADQ